MLKIFIVTIVGRQIILMPAWGDLKKWYVISLISLSVLVLTECGAPQFDTYYIPPAMPTPAKSKSVMVQPDGTHLFIDMINTSTHIHDIDNNSSQANIQYGSSYLLESVQSFRQEAKAIGNPQDELELYLNCGPEVTTNVIAWWGCQDSRYPTLRRMARDYLAIQGSATPSECAFSSGGITDTAHRNRLSPNLFEALQILKSAYRNQHITAVHQAAQHVDALIAQQELETEIDDVI